MKIDEAKQEFIQAWGILGSSWGINKTMAQIQALLLISPEALSTEDVMSQLSISRGNVNMNIRALMDWGLVFKEFKKGERREYFNAKKDVWEIARQVAKERKKREIDPLIEMLSKVQKIDMNYDAEVVEFKKVTKSLLEFSNSMNSVLDKFTKSEPSWFYKLLLKFK